MIFKYFLWPVFSSFSGVFYRAKILSFDKIQCIDCFLLWIVILVSVLRTLHLKIFVKSFLLCFLLKALYFIFRSMIYFELIFYKV